MGQHAMSKRTARHTALRPVFSRVPPRAAQEGVVLFIALVVLVAMMLAGLSLMRSVTSNTLVVGNLASKQTITNAGDWGVEAGRAWTLAQPVGDLTRDKSSAGYFSSWDGNFDPVNAPTNWWKENGQSVALTGSPLDVAGMDVRWVVHRLCSTADLDVNSPGQQCVTLQSAGYGSSKGAGDYTGQPLANTQQPYYRVTVRVVDPRMTISYIQTVIY
jgi:Tfp pilus assembly protein PilX